MLAFSASPTLNYTKATRGLCVLIEFLKIDIKLDGFFSLVIWQHNSFVLTKIMSWLQETIAWVLFQLLAVLYHRETLNSSELELNQKSIIMAFPQTSINYIFTNIFRSACKWQNHLTTVYTSIDYFSFSLI